MLREQLCRMAIFSQQPQAPVRRKYIVETEMHVPIMQMSSVNETFLLNINFKGFSNIKFANGSSYRTARMKKLRNSP